jgi:hypothetical protein
MKDRIKLRLNYYDKIAMWGSHAGAFDDSSISALLNNQIVLDCHDLYYIKRF